MKHHGAASRDVAEHASEESFSRTPGRSTLSSHVQLMPASSTSLPATRQLQLKSAGAIAAPSGQSFIESIFPGAVQHRVTAGGGEPSASTDRAHQAAAAGIQGGGGPLPHLDKIQASFGAQHDVSGIAAHVGGATADACASMGASAYATGNHVGFAGSPDLHTAAHEAAHVVQQRGGVQLKGGVGQAGDAYEQHADAVADRVVRGESAADLLGEQGAAPGAHQGPAQKGACAECGGAPAGTGDCPACKATEALGAITALPAATTGAAVQRQACDPSVASCPFEDGGTASSEPNASYPPNASSEPNMSGGPNASTAPTTGNQASGTRYPNQTCPDDVLDALQTAMHAVCDLEQSTCNPKKVSQKRLDKLSCDEVAQRVARNRACLEARRRIQSVCFGGVPDERHRVKIEESERSVQHCETLLQRCRQREQERTQPRTLPSLDQVLNALAVLGLSLALAAAVIAALADPEPASKVALAVGSASLALMILQRLGIEPEEGFQA